jgi:hypothetical protein
MLSTYLSAASHRENRLQNFVLGEIPLRSQSNFSFSVALTFDSALNRFEMPSAAQLCLIDDENKRRTHFATLRFRLSPLTILFYLGAVPFWNSRPNSSVALIHRIVTSKIVLNQ